MCDKAVCYFQNGIVLVANSKLLGFACWLRKKHQYMIKQFNVIVFRESNPRKGKRLAAQLMPPPFELITIRTDKSSRHDSPLRLLAVS